MRRQTITVATQSKRQIIDITDEVNGVLKKAGVADGLCSIFSQHTTTAVTIGEMEEGAIHDFLEFIEKVIPKMQFRHAHKPNHAQDHLIGGLMGPSVTIPVTNGKLDLGTWQRVMFIELDGPRERTVSLNFIT